jgi:hypothetical protein
MGPYLQKKDQPYNRYRNMILKILIILFILLMMALFIQFYTMTQR